MEINKKMIMMLFVLFAGNLAWAKTNWYTDVKFINKTGDTFEVEGPGITGKQNLVGMGTISLTNAIETPELGILEHPGPFGRNRIEYVTSSMISSYKIWKGMAGLVSIEINAINSPLSPRELRSIGIYPGGPDVKQSDGTNKLGKFPTYADQSIACMFARNQIAYKVTLHAHRINGKSTVEISIESVRPA